MIKLPFPYRAAKHVNQLAHGQKLSGWDTFYLARKSAERLHRRSRDSGQRDSAAERHRQRTIDNEAKARGYR